MELENFEKESNFEEKNDKTDIQIFTFVMKTQVQIQNEKNMDGETV